jgi:predicted nucleic acid-binding protein
VSGLVVDTSAWIDFLAGEPVPSLDSALSLGITVTTPVVVAELLSGARTSVDRMEIVSLFFDLPVHESGLEHWIRVGELRRHLKERGLTVSTPDAHVAQCALDRGAPLLSRDRIFSRIAEHCRLEVLAD